MRKTLVLLVIAALLLSGPTAGFFLGTAKAAPEVAGFLVLAPSEGMIIGNPLRLLIFARDANDVTDQNFTGTVNFSASIGTVTPTKSGAFTQGSWSGSLNISFAGYEIENYDTIIIQVDDGSGHTGSSFPIPVSFPVPQITLLSPQSEMYNESDVPLVFWVDAPATWMGYSLDRKQAVTVMGNTSLFGLVNGTYSLAVYANNSFGMMGTSEAVRFSVAAAGPPPEPDGTEQEPFPIVPVAIASAGAVAAVGLGLFVYFRKRRSEAKQE